jgi:hypothetical protein
LKAAFADDEKGKGKSVHGRYVGQAAGIVKPVLAGSSPHLSRVVPKKVAGCFQSVNAM